MAWMLDETAYAGRENLDPDHVARYDRKTAAEPYDDLDTLLQLRLSADSTLIDLGAGTGRMTLAAASRCRRVIAVDVSPPMLAHLRERVEAAGSSNVEVVEAGFMSYEHEGPLADIVYCRNALHHVPDFWKAIALHRIASFLRPGGVLRLRDIVYSFELHDATARLDEWMRTAPEAVTDGWTRADLEEHVRDEHSTYTWLLEPMIERAGFRITDAQYSENQIFAGYICTKAGSSS
jgi:ubiquinone/menaquinone biosynthesis C-methylase UbiE